VAWNGQGSINIVDVERVGLHSGQPGMFGRNLYHMATKRTTTFFLGVRHVPYLHRIH
jgi:hypothetical protein